MGFELRQGLNLNASNKWISCTADEKRRRDYRLVNMRARNPMESDLKKLCFIGVNLGWFVRLFDSLDWLKMFTVQESECIGRREGSFNRCFSSSQYCKSVDFKEGGGLVSCFSKKSTSFKEPHHYILGLDGKTCKHILCRKSVV